VRANLAGDLFRAQQSSGCTKPWYYKVPLNFSRSVEKGLKTTKTAFGKDKLLLLAIFCIVLILGVAMLVQTSIRNGFLVNECTISQIISKPADWENKTVKVKGIVEEIPIGIIQPFNYWLTDRQNQTIRIGLRWHSDNNLSGRNLTVTGVVKKGYAWVNPNYLGWWTYYIEATSIFQD
jgi:hypothetical protein